MKYYYLNKLIYLKKRTKNTKNNIISFIEELNI